MANLATLTVRIEADTRGFTRGLTDAKRSLGSFQGSVGGIMTNVAGSVIKTGALVGTAAVAGLVAFGVESIKTAATFDAAMRNVNAIAQLPEAQFQALKERVIEFSLTTRAGSEDIANALFNVVSAGFDTEEGFLVMEQASRAAGAGLAQTEDTSRLLIAALRAYKIPVQDAGKVTDLFLQTVNQGILRLPDLANNLGRILPVAASAGISLEEVSFALAQMTQTGLSTEEATTRLLGLVTKFLKPTQQMKEAFEELGFATGLEMVNAVGGLLPALKVLRDEGFIDTADKTAELFSNVRAMGGALALMSNDANLADGAVEAFGKSSEGAVTRAREQQYKSLSAQIAKLKSAFEVIMITVGDQFIPLLVELSKNAIFPLLVRIGEFIALFAGNFKKAMKAGMNPLQAFNDTMRKMFPPDVAQAVQILISRLFIFADKVKAVLKFVVPLAIEHMPQLMTAFKVFGAFLLAAKIAPILLGIFSLVSTIGGAIAAGFLSGGVIGAIGAVGGVIAGLLGPIGLIIIAVTALIFAWKTNFGGIQEITKSVISDTIMPIVQRLRAFLMTELPPVIAALRDFWEKTLLPALMKVGLWIKENLLPFFEALANFFIDTLMIQLKILANIWEKVLFPALKLIWAWIKDKILPIFEELGKVVLPIVADALKVIAGIFDDVTKVMGFLGDAFDDMEIPAWLQPGSATPLEEGLVGISDKMNMAQTSADALAGVMSGMPEQMNTGLVESNFLLLQFGEIASAVFQGLQTQTTAAGQSIGALSDRMSQLALSQAFAGLSAQGQQTGGDVFNLAIQSNAQTEQVEQNFELMRAQRNR